MRSPAAAKLRTRALALALAAGALACREAPPPLVLGVDPSAAPDDADTWLAVRGRHFQAAVQADFDAPDRSRVRARFAVEIFRTGEAPVSLPDVALVSDSEIRARLPAGAPAGLYGVAVVDPRGRRTSLDAALEVFAPCGPDESPCDDGDACTLGDLCQGGRCRPGAPAVCVPSGQCHVAGACNPATGLCSDPPAQDGTPCRLACATGETCRAGDCLPPPGGCRLDTAPLARLAVRPTAGTPSTAFTLDASGSTDLEDPLGSLTAEFDFDGTGLFSSAGPASQPVTHAWGVPGLFRPTVKVTDPAGLAGYATAMVPVVAGADLVEVTTALDEADPGATPASPGGTGLSLREAVAWVNGQPRPKTIAFAASISGVVAMTQPNLRSLTLSAPGAAVVGKPGVTLDFGGYNQACLRLTGPGQLLLGLAVTGCSSGFVQLLPGSQGSQVAFCTLGPGPGALGVDAQADSLPAASPASLVGPGNDLSDLGVGVRVLGTDYAVAGNRVHGNATGISVNGVRCRLSGNAVFLQVAAGPNTGTGLRVFNGAGPVQVWNNVFDGNAADGLQADAVPLDVRNDVFTGNAGFGVRAQAASFAPGGFDHNGFHANGLGPVGSGLATGPTDVLADPIFLGRAAGDYRLSPGSPAIDAGVDTGLDVNGPAPGRFNGLAPDLGSEESPYARP